MYVVECPSCRQRFKVPQAIAGARMKCSQCGHVFVGSSLEQPDEPAAQPAGAAGEQPRPAPVAQTKPAAAIPPAPRPAVPRAPGGVTPSAQAAGAMRSPAPVRPVAPRPLRPVAPAPVLKPAEAPVTVVPSVPAPAPLGGALSAAELAALARARRSRNAVIMVVACFFALAGLIGMGIFIWYSQTHQTVTWEDVDEHGNLIGRRTVSLEEAKRMKAEQAAKIEERERKRQEAMNQTNEVRPPVPQPPVSVRPPDSSTTEPGPTPASQPEVAAPGPPPIPPEDLKEDENLQVGVGIISDQTVGANQHVCGRILNKYPKPLKSVKVTAYVKGYLGPSATCEYVPAKKETQYSLELGSGNFQPDDVKVVAKAGPFEEKLAVWALDPDDINRKETDEKLVWSGRVRNPTDRPVKNVKIYFDFFTAQGQWMGRATADVLRSIPAAEKDKPKASEPFSVEIDLNPAAERVVARAVGEKY